MSLADLLNLTPEKIADIQAALAAVPSLRDRLQTGRVGRLRPALLVWPAAREAFFDKLSRCKSPVVSHQPGAVSLLHKAWGGQCVYCGRKLPHPYDVNEDTPRSIVPCREHLIPMGMGGSKASKGVLSCIGCNTAKSNKDWLDFGHARSPAVGKKLAALRMEMGRASFNHWSRDPKVHTPLKVGRMLDARWQHPRFKVYAAVTGFGAWIGWKSSWPMPQAAYFIMKGLHGKFVSRPQGHSTLDAFEFDQLEDAIEAIWALIEHNAWVLGFDMEAEGYKDITPTTSPTWRFWSPNFRDLCRRELTKDRPKRSRWKPYRRRNRE